MPRPIAEQVVVVTGASSGIGRATAIELGRRGARVVLAARGEESLGAAVREVEVAGGQALGVPTDVSDWAAMQRLAEAAVLRFGCIDTWVNNAAVALYATVDDSSVEEQRRVVDVNVMGVVHGVKAALPHLRAAGGGTLINVASVLGVAPAPYLAIYTATKHAVRGYSDALRIELEREADLGGPPIAVTVIQPSSINTPFFENARSRLGVLPRPIPPAYRPSLVAEAIAYCAEHPRRDVIVGEAGKVFEVAHRISPRLLDVAQRAGGLMFRAQESDERDDGRDNLFAPLPGPGRVEGRWAALTLPGSPWTRAFGLHPRRARAAQVVLVAGVAAAVGLRVRRR
jgi:short-subunit dehydrogenase